MRMIVYYIKSVPRDWVLFGSFKESRSTQLATINFSRKQICTEIRKLIHAKALVNKQRAIFY